MFPGKSLPAQLPTSRRLVLWLVLIFPLAGFAPLEVLFAPTAEPWPRWERQDPDSTATIDFSAWDALLKRHVRASPDGINRIGYGAFGDDDTLMLEKVVAELASLPVGRYNRDEQLAYWINLYNAVTLKVVLDHFPVASIRDIDISPGLFADGPWDRELVTVEGQALSLNDIEHRILRPLWRDPRQHYAVNCASLGCPSLARDAYEGRHIDAMLEMAARAYVNDPRGVLLTGDRVSVSKIYVWFREDFGGSSAAVLKHLKRYAAPALAERLEAIDEIGGSHYDWRLNAVTSPP